jgi:hypothetical protein
MTVPEVDLARERHWICAKRLRERRLALGLTQRDVVDRLRMRGSPTTNRALSAMENGRGLDLGMLPELAQSLTCSVTYLLGLTTDPAAWRPDGQPIPASSAGPAAHGTWCSGVLGPYVPVARIRRGNGNQSEEVDRDDVVTPAGRPVDG